ncbi:RNP-1 like RNA-binding protein, partial [Pelagophyceae sp. CCMP2097]
PKQLYVKGLQRGTTLSDVRLAFEAVCEVTAVSMPRDKETGLNKGFAFVELAEESDSTYVCGCMDGASVGGKPIICR